MKRSLFPWFAAAMLLALCLMGCKSKPEAPAIQDTAPTVGATEGAGSAVIPAAQPAYANPFSELPPEGDVVVTNLAFGQDLWPDYSYYPILTLRVLSKHVLDETDCSVRMPIRTGYRAAAHQLSVTPAPAGELKTEGGFPYFLYQIYRGTDWKKMAELELDAASGNELNAYGEQYRGDYLALTARDLPHFFLYEVQIQFPASAEGNTIFDEECSRIELHLGDFDTVLDGGSFRLHADPLPLEPYKNDTWLGVKPGMLANPIGTASCPWNDGIERLELLMDLDVQEDVTLTSFSLYESRIELLELYVAVSSESGGSMDFAWDGKTPMKLKAGVHVAFSAVIRDPLAANQTVETDRGVVVRSCYDYASRIIGILRYDCGADKGTLWTEHNLTRYPNPWETYAVRFDGLDISSYYLDYYQPFFNSWRAEFTEVQP